MFFTRFLPKQVRFAYRWDARSAWLSGLYAGMTAPFFGVIARRDLHASAFEISLLISAPFLGNLLSMFVAWHMQNRAKKPYMYWLTILGRAPLLLMAFITTTPLFIGLIIVTQIIGSFNSPAYASIMKDAYPDRLRGQLMGLVRVGMTVMAMLGGLAAGQLMKDGLAWYWGALIGLAAALVIAHELQSSLQRVLVAGVVALLTWLALPALAHGLSYRVLFPVAGVLGVLAVWLFNHVPEGDPNMSPEKRFNVLEGLATLYHDKRFGLYTMAFFTFGFGNLLQSPLIPLFQVDELHITYDWVGWLAMVSAGTSAIAYGLWGRFMDRVGPFYVVVLSFAICSLSPFVYAASHSLPALFIASILMGIGAPGVDLTWLNAVMNFTDRDNIPRYAALHTFMVGIRGLLAPFVAAWLLTFVSLRHCFLVSAAIAWSGTLFMAAVVWLLLLPAQRARKAARRHVPA